MIDVLIDLPAHVRKRLTAALDSGLLASPYAGAALRSVLGNGEDVESIGGALEEMTHMGISGRSAAAWIRMAEQIVSRQQKPDVVWSGPEAPGLHARDTRRVYEELLGSAEKTIWASTYAFFDGPRAFEVLARRMEVQANLQVTLLLNIQRKFGDTTVSDQLVRRFADRFWKLEWPGTSRPRVFYDPRALDLNGPTGVLHAKAVITDEALVFVTSANLTEAAFDRNIELGVLLRDRTMAANITKHFRTLIERGLLNPLPLA